MLYALSIGFTNIYEFWFTNAGDLSIYPTLTKTGWIPIYKGIMSPYCKTDIFLKKFSSKYKADYSITSHDYWSNGITSAY